MHFEHTCTNSIYIFLYLLKLKAISQWMINFRDTISKRPINLIDRDRFIEYYMAISSTIIDDCYFDLLIKNTYNII